MKRLLKTKRAIAVLTVAVLALASVGVLIAATDSGKGGRDLRFNAWLHGAQEVTSPTPPSLGVTSATRGGFALDFNVRLAVARYWIGVNNGVDITAAHIHCGKAGRNGPVVATLYGGPPLAAISGRLHAGNIRNANIAANACTPVIGRDIMNVADLLEAATNGELYVNVHSAANPGGEVRGQIIKD